MVTLEPIKEVFDSGDPIVRTWSFVHSYWTPFICSAIYILFVKRIGPAIMRDRQPFDLRNLMILYNFTIVLSYLTCLLTLLYNMFFTEAIQNLCNPTEVVENHYTYRCASAGWYIYILKYVEFLDTVFFVLRKKHHLITNLHLVHHSTLPIISWVMLRTERSGFQFIPAGLNSFIHMIMYTYYGLAAMGPEVQKRLWWKEYLTLVQMMQFVIIILFAFIIVPLSGCTTTKYGIYMDTFFATAFLAMFYNFYTKTYKPKKQNEIKASSYKIPNGVNGVHMNGELKQNGECKQNGEYRQNGECKQNGEYKRNGKISSKEN